MEARFTFVARSRETGKSTPVTPLLVETPLEEEQFRQVEERMNRKKAARKSKAGVAAVQDHYDAESTAASLVEQGQLLLALPALADPNAVLMKSTALSSTIVCMPQERNAANRIFGGFLMNRAFELAFATAYTTSGSRPHFVEVDEIAFLQGVEIGGE